MMQSTKHEWPECFGDEFHNLQELILNIDFQTGELSGSWGNLGYWKDSNGTEIHQYALAAKQLAQELGEFAHLTQDSRLLDVGFGCGDQLICWSEIFSVNFIYGVNLSRIQTEYAKRKISFYGFKNTPYLVQGDICSHEVWQGLTQSFDCIIALDCAYHFSDKNYFFSLCKQHFDQCHTHEGVIVLSDFIFSENDISIFDKLWLRIVCYFSHIPFSNIKKQSSYDNELQNQGLELLDVKDITEDVIKPFSGWVFKLNKGMKCLDTQGFNFRGINKRHFLKYIGTALFLRWISKKNILRYVFLRIGVKR